MPSLSQALRRIDPGPSVNVPIVWLMNWIVNLISISIDVFIFSPSLQGSLCIQERGGSRMSHILKSPYDRKEYRFDKLDVHFSFYGSVINILTNIFTQRNINANIYLIA